MPEQLIARPMIGTRLPFTKAATENVPFFNQTKVQDLRPVGERRALDVVDDWELASAPLTPQGNYSTRRALETSPRQSKLIASPCLQIHHLEQRCLEMDESIHRLYVSLIFTVRDLKLAGMSS